MESRSRTYTLLVRKPSVLALDCLQCSFQLISVELAQIHKFAAQAGLEPTWDVRRHFTN